MEQLSSFLDYLIMAGGLLREETKWKLKEVCSEVKKIQIELS